MSGSDPQTLRPRPTARHHAGKQASNARQALDLREHTQHTARPPVCSWERSNGLAALGTATINLADASASRVARLPFYHGQPAAASHKLNTSPAACRASSQAPFVVPFPRERMCDEGWEKDFFLQPRFVAFAIPCALSCEPDTSPRLHTYIQ